MSFHTHCYIYTSYITNSNLIESRISNYVTLIIPTIYGIFCTRFHPNTVLSLYKAL